MTDAVHRNVSRVVEAGAAIGLDVAPVRFPEGTKTAVDAANAIGCDQACSDNSLSASATNSTAATMREPACSAACTHNTASIAISSPDIPTLKRGPRVSARIPEGICSAVYT